MAVTRALRLLLCIALGLGCAASLPAPARAASSETFISPQSPDRPPPGFRLSAVQAFAIAERTQAVRTANASYGGLRGEPLWNRAGFWAIQYMKDGKVRAEIRLDGRAGRVTEAWSGQKATWNLARGSDSLLGRRNVNSIWVWALLIVLFVLPFADVRRPLRRRHLDLALLLSFCIPYALWQAGQLELSQYVLWGLLAALCARLALVATRGAGDGGPLFPHLSPRVVLALAAGLVVLRAGLTFADRAVIDVGIASVGGADRILDGQDVYVRGGGAFDTYGPAVYLAYIPFELVWPIHSLGDTEPFAAQAAAIAWDALTALALFALGRRLDRDGPLGIALAYAWLAYPFTALSETVGSNDALPALALAGALLVGSPAGKGAAAGLAAAAKFAPGAAGVVLLAAQSGARRAALFAGAAVVTVVATFALLIPDGGLGEIWSETIGFQADRDSPFSVWAYHGLDAVQPFAAVLVVAAIAALALRARRHSGPVAVAAGAAAAIVATQLVADHWFYLYLAWALPAALVALLATGPLTQRPARPAPGEAP